MDWLVDNPLGNLPGPAFLGLYLAVFVFAVLALRMGIHRMTQDGAANPMPIPEHPDPFSIAYLRGGTSEMLRTVMVDLVERGRLAEDTSSLPKRRLPAVGGRWIATHSDEALESLPPIHRAILDVFRNPKSSAALVDPSILAVANTESARYEKWAEENELVVPASSRSAFRTIHAMTVIGFAGLGGYKLFAAAMHHRSNVGFLVFMLVAGIAMLVIAGQFRRTTARGRTYLRDLQAAFEPVRKIKDVESSGRPAQLAFADASLPLLAMGIYGASSLYGSSLDPVARVCYGASMSAGGCGAVGGCGSGCSSASSCSGGSSCGGGGGGCGGCGS